MLFWLFASLLTVSAQPTVLKSLVEKKPLLFVVNSIEAPAVIEERFKPLINYLEKQLQRKIDFKVPRTYQHGNQLLLQEIADIAVLGPSPFIKLSQQAPQQFLPLVTMENDHSPPFLWSGGGQKRF